MTTTEQMLEHRRNKQAQAAALSAVEGLAVTPTGIVQYSSRGRLLVIGSAAAQQVAAMVEPPLHAQLLLLEGAEEPGVPVIHAGGRAIRISGHLGAFRIELGDAGKPNHQLVEVDLVLDLGDRPLIQRDIPPPGYWSANNDPLEVEDLLAELQEMTGTFEKPRFFNYDPDICAHSRAGREGCSRCLESCPAEAIVSIGDQVQVDPNLCQGGGICATVCPTGAMRYAYPGPEDSGMRLRLMLMHYRMAGGTNPVVLLVAEADVSAFQQLPPNVLMIVVEELGSIGIENWLSALAWGAGAVVLADNGSVPGRVRTALAAQVRLAEELLGGMGYPERAIRLLTSPDLEAECRAVMPSIEPAAYGAMDQKRTMLLFALDHLFDQSGSEIASIGLPDGSPFGQIDVDRDACTLCMGCTSVCPAKALEAGNDAPRLVFHESNCVQCGLCEKSCPENAISLHARFITDPGRRRIPRLLVEEEPFLCVSCGKPYATRSMIDNMLEKLSGHYMFQSERARRRLQMCEDCRVVDAVQDPDAIETGLAPPRNTNS